MDPCPERDALKTDAKRKLHDIIEFSNKLLFALDNDLPSSLTPLDQDLENAVGAKERAFGALAQHRKDHGC